VVTTANGIGRSLGGDRNTTIEKVDAYRASHALAPGERSTEEYPY